MSGQLHVVAESAYPAVAASSRVRVVDMGAHLAAHGIAVDFRPSLNDSEYGVASAGGDPAARLAALARGSLRASRPAGAPGTLTLVHRLRSLLPTPRDLTAACDVYDFDDSLFVKARGPHRRRASLFKLEAERATRSIRTSRLVLAGNRYLADAAGGIARGSTRIEVVPSCVDVEHQPVRAHRDVETLTLGWVGSPTTGAYLEQAIEWLRPAIEQDGSIRLLVMGAEPRVQHDWIELRRWSVEAEAAMLAELDVGLMPLPDDPWTRGKCGYKLLRYGAAGLPSIASPVGVNAELVGDGRGIAASTPAQWAGAIRALRETAVRRELGTAARSHVERSYSYTAWAPRLAELLRGLAGG